MRARAGFWAATVVFAAVLGVLAAVLPDRVPLHFGPGGQPDSVGNRTTFLALAAGTGVLVVVLIGGSAAAVDRMPLRWINVPHREQWTAPEHQPELRRRLRTDLLVIGAATLLLLSAMFAFTADAALDGGPLSRWALVVLGGYLVAVLGYVGHALTRRYRPPPG